MKISVAADEKAGVADAVVEELRRRGHEPIVHGALADGERDDWAWASEAAARDVADGRAEQGIVCCWTGTGASIAANKVPGIRAALCGDAGTAAGARKWNDANVLALSLRGTREALPGEIQGRPGLACLADRAADLGGLPQVEDRLLRLHRRPLRARAGADTRRCPPEPARASRGGPSSGT